MRRILSRDRLHHISREEAENKKQLQWRKPIFSQAPWLGATLQPTNTNPTKNHGKAPELRRILAVEPVVKRIASGRAKTVTLDDFGAATRLVLRSD
jgi:hypothetical protein